MIDICGYEYKPTGVCAYRIKFDLIDGVIRNVLVEGGCDGGHQGLARMTEGRSPEEVIPICKKVGCHQGNSCPRQFALALEECIERMRVYLENREEDSCADAL